MADDDRGHLPRVTRLWASNYRSLNNDVEVDFGSLTALVGLNGAGKSSVLDVLRFVRDALSEGLETAVSRRLGIARLRRVPTWDKPRNMSVHIGLDGAAARWVYGFTLAAVQGGTFRISYEYLSRSEGDSEDYVLQLEVRDAVVRVAPPGLAPAASARELVLPSIAAHPAVRPALQALRQVRVHSIYPRVLAVPQPVGMTPPLDDDGTNWAVVLQALTSDRKAQLVGALSAVLPDLLDLKVETANGFRTVEFVYRAANGRRRSFNAAQESDGTLRIAGILTALLQDDEPSFLGIEEPELTINPGLLPLLVDHLREAASRTTVVITSHSPDLLDLVGADEVRVVEQRDGQSFVSPLAAGQAEVVRRQLMGTGDLLRTGGLVGEHPPQAHIEDVSDVVVVGAPE